MVVSRCSMGFAAIAALMVVVFHSLFWWSPLGLVAPFFHNGEFAVEIFFALSGYVLTVSYGNRVARQGFRHYAGRRVARLVPLHLFCFALVLGVFGWYKIGPTLGLHKTFRPKFFNLHELLPQLTLTQSLGTNPLAWNFPSWSLSCELWASLMLGVFFFAAVRLRRAILVVAIAVSLVLLWRSSSTLVFTYTVWRGLLTVCIGALVATIPKSVRVPAWVSAAVLVVTPFAMIQLHDGYAMSAHGHRELVFPFFAGVLVFAIAQGSGPAIAVLSVKPVRELGRRSYSLYLLHAPVLIFVVLTAVMLGPQAYHRLFTGFTGGVFFGTYVAFLIFVSGFTVKYVEKMGQAQVRKLLRVA